MALTVQQIQRLLRQAFEETANDKKLVAQALYWTTLNHQRNRWTRKFHSPDKVSKDENDGSIAIDNPDAVRAYRDVTILPVRAKKLTIPCHRDAVGRRASEFKLFRIKNGLYRRDGSGIVRMYNLADKAFQKKDPTILPSDETYAENVNARFWKAFNDRFSRLVSQHGG